MEKYRKVTRKGQRILRHWLGHLFPPLPQPDLFPSQVILHFSHHKCLTGYYNMIMGQLGEEFNFPMQHFGSNVRRFETAVINARKKGEFSLNNTSDFDLAHFPEFRGSHFIRDPRDLIVSGYHYHLSTLESWCITQDYPWDETTRHPYFTSYVEADLQKFPKNVSYQDYLKTLDPERGILLELIWRQFGFTAMLSWKPNPYIIEFKYETIVGNEVESFRKIFEHYEFHPKLVKRGLTLVDAFSLKNIVKGENRHARKGTSGQWKSEFTPRVTEAFKNLNGNLLIHLEYEKDNHW